MKFINLTPHTINVVNDDGTTVNFTPSGVVARVATNTTVVGFVDGITVRKDTFGDVTFVGADNTPADAPQLDGVAYIVSGFVAQAANRLDFFRPGDLVRNDAGQPIGCKGLKV